MALLHLAQRLAPAMVQRGKGAIVVDRQYLCPARTGQLCGLRADQGRTAHPRRGDGARSRPQGRPCRLCPDRRRHRSSPGRASAIPTRRTASSSSPRRSPTRSGTSSTRTAAPGRSTSRSARSARNGEGDGRPAHLLLFAEPEDLEGDDRRSPHAASRSRSVAPSPPSSRTGCGTSMREPLVGRDRATLKPRRWPGWLQGRHPDQDRCVPGRRIRSPRCRRPSVPTVRPASSNPTASCERSRAWARTPTSSTAAMPTRPPASTASSMPVWSSGAIRNPISSPCAATAFGRPPRPRSRRLRRLSGRHRPGAASRPALSGRRRPLACRHLLRGRALPLLQRAPPRRRSLASAAWRRFWPTAGARRIPGPRRTSIGFRSPGLCAGCPSLSAEAGGTCHMTNNPAQDVALIVGGGPGISSSCARLFAKEGMRVAVAARHAGQAGPAGARESPWRAPLCLRR